MRSHESRGVTWPPGADRVPLDELFELTGVATWVLDDYRGGRAAPSESTVRSVEVVASLPEGSPVLRTHSSWPRLGRLVRESLGRRGSPDLVSAVRSACARGSSLTSEVDLAAFFARPPSTGSRGWDALLAGVAEYAVGDRGDHLDPRVLEWTREGHLFLDSPWSPSGDHARRASSLLLTPVELREHGVVLPWGELAWV